MKFKDLIKESTLADIIDQYNKLSDDKKKEFRQKIAKSNPKIARILKNVDSLSKREKEAKDLLRKIRNK
jgi:hypothetical protein